LPETLILAIARTSLFRLKGLSKGCIFFSVPKKPRLTGRIFKGVLKRVDVRGKSAWQMRSIKAQYYVNIGVLDFLSPR
jgi:hypothetical protein